jgi:hypothetical protein
MARFYSKFLLINLKIGEAAWSKKARKIKIFKKMKQLKKV